VDVVSEVLLERELLQGLWSSSPGPELGFETTNGPKLTSAALDAVCAVKVDSISADGNSLSIAVVDEDIAVDVDVVASCVVTGRSGP